MAFSNEIYIRQTGDLFDSNITQDGDNNKIRSLNTVSGDAVIGGNNKIFTVTQTGDNNRAGFWTERPFAQLLGRYGYF